MTAAGVDTGLWGRLEQGLGLVSMRPRLADDVRIRTIGDDHELVQTSTRRVVPLGEDDVELVRRFDGEHTVAELIVAGIGRGRLEVEPVLVLLDRLLRAELLAEHPPNLYRQVVAHLARVGGAPARDDAGFDPAAPEAGQAPELVTPWRARSPKLEDRARFLRSVTLFAALDTPSIGALTDGAHEEHWPAKAPIVSQGGRGDRFFVVRSGEVVVERRGEGDEFLEVARLASGEWFGEAALLDGVPRNATVRAGEARTADLLSFDAETFDRYIRPHVTTSPSSVAAAVTHGTELVSSRRARLEGVPVFGALAPDDLDRLARVLREEHVDRGTVLFRQGEIADRFYVIVEGAVGVVKNGTPIAKLVAGEFFGETALLFTEGRTATIAATEDSRFWTLDRDAFQAFIRDALLHRTELMPTVLNRLDSNDPV